MVTELKFSDILQFHKSQNAAATMAVRTHETVHSFGVVNLEGLNISRVEEKPVLKHYINAGVYVLASRALSVLTHNHSCAMPELFNRLVENGEQVVAFPMHEPWFDIGRPEDLVAANQGQISRE